MAVSDYPASVPTAVVSIDVRDPLTPQADQPRDGSVSFAIRCDLRSPVSGTIIRAATRTVHLVDGLGEVELPQYDTAAIPGDWWIEVSKSWLAGAYSVRIPAGKTAVNLAELDDINASARAARTLQGISDVKISYTDDGSSWSSFEGGVWSIGTPRPSGTLGPPLADDGLTMAMVSDGVEAAFRRGASVMEYGAKGDGVADDTAAINAAAQAAGMGGLVWFPAGVYRISGTVSCLQNQRWSGPAQNMDGANVTGATIIASHAGVAVEAQPAATIEQLGIYGPNCAAGSVGVSAIKTSSVTLRGVSIWRFDIGTSVDSLWYGHFDRCFWWKNRVAFKSVYSYNVNFVVPRIQCTMDSGTLGTGMMLTDRSWVTIHGGTIEQYTVGVDLGLKSHLRSYGLYMETYAAGASGIKVTSTGASVGVHGSQVYLTNHKAWIDMTVARPSVLNASDNHFHSGTAGATAEVAYDWSGSTGGLRLYLAGDAWADARTDGPRWACDEPIPGGSGVVAAPYGAPAFGPAGRKLVDGRTHLGGHLMADLSVKLPAVTSSKRPAMLPEWAGATVYDTTLKKVITYDGAAWRDAMGTAV